MAVMWNGSLIPWLDANGDPLRGARAYFFDEMTTTPRTVYRDGGLNEFHDHPVVANAAGMFPPIFMGPGSYRLRITDETGVTIWDVDEISSPAVSDEDPPDAGETSITLLARTGDLKPRHGVGVHSGWVRANGRTIGGTASGATERANADTEELFIHLWNEDETLVVSGGRGANAASDFASSKTIALPDYRHYPIVGLGDMGNTNANRIPDALFTSGDNITLGSVAGSATVTLANDHLPSHNHSNGSLTAASAGAHNHGALTGAPISDGGRLGRGSGQESTSTQGASIQQAGAHTHNVTGSTSNTGGGQAHPNVQPSKLATIYIKL